MSTESESIPARRSPRGPAAGGAPAPRWRSPSLPIAVGISSCLLGEEVRYDGGHPKDS